jgi:hypothetical protein
LSTEHEGEAAGLNTFSSEEQEVGDPLCQGLESAVVGELFLEFKFGKDFDDEAARG